MAIIVNGTTIPINGDFIVANGTNITKVVANGVTVWEKVIKKYIWNGTTLQAAGYDGFTIQDNRLRSMCEADNESDTSKTVSVIGIDLTGYSKLTVTSQINVANAFGEVYVKYGIDSASSQFFSLPSGTGFGSQTFTGTLNVSGYSGSHNLVFYQYARNDSSYDGYFSDGNLGITEIIVE